MIPEHESVGSEPQISFFESSPVDPAEQEILDRLRLIDPNGMTPIEALAELAALKGRIDRS